MANREGRPPKLDADFIAKALAYLDSYEDDGKVIPSIAGLSRATGVYRSTLHAWMAGELPMVEQDIIDQFSDIINAISVEQEEKLLQGGLSNSMNATICKLVLGKHGYSDKVEQDNRSTDGSMSPAGTLKVTISRPKEK